MRSSRIVYSFGLRLISMRLVVRSEEALRGIVAEAEEPGIIEEAEEEMLYKCSTSRTLEYGR